LQLAISLAEQKQQKLDNQLENYKQVELKKVESDVATMKKELVGLVQAVTISKLDLSESRAELKTTNGTIQTVMAEIAEKERILARLEGKNSSTLADISVLEASKVALNNELLELEAQVKDLKNNLDNTLEKLKKLKGEESLAEGRIEALDSDYDIRKKQLDDELRAILSKTSDCLTRLKQFEQEEIEKRQALSTDLMAMEKERESLLNLKASLKDADAKLLKRRQLMRL